MEWILQNLDWATGAIMAPVLILFLFIAYRYPNASRERVFWVAFAVVLVLFLMVSSAELGSLSAFPWSSVHHSEQNLRDLEAMAAQFPEVWQMHGFSVLERSLQSRRPLDHSMTDTIQRVAVWALFFFLLSGALAALRLMDLFWKRESE